MEQREPDTLTRLRQRDASAIEALFDQYAYMLSVVINRFVNSQEVADDILVQTFVEVWRTIGSFEESEERLDLWLVHTARRHAEAYYVERKRRSSLIVIDSY